MSTTSPLPPTNNPANGAPPGDEAKLHLTLPKGFDANGDLVTREQQYKSAFMLAAACSAYAGVSSEQGGPFGCSVVDESADAQAGGEILSCSHNTVLEV